MSPTSDRFCGQKKGARMRGPESRPASKSSKTDRAHREWIDEEEDMVKASRLEIQGRGKEGRKIVIPPTRSEKGAGLWKATQNSALGLIREMMKLQITTWTSSQGPTLSIGGAPKRDESGLTKNILQPLRDQPRGRRMARRYW